MFLLKAPWVTDKRNFYSTICLAHILELTIKLTLNFLYINNGFIYYRFIPCLFVSGFYSSSHLIILS